VVKGLLERFLELQETGPEEYLTVCPYHDDDKPSLSINFKKKVFFCHACQEKGKPEELLAKLHDAPAALVRWELDHLKDFKPPKFDYVRFHDKLMNYDRLMTFLYEERKWSPKVIEELLIGWDGGRITIPVFNVFGDLVNVRAYKPKAAKDEPKVINLKGYGKARLFLPRNLCADEIFICEGEPDAIAGYSLGLPTISSTAGAGHFNPAWASVFRGKSVYLLYDIDEAGVRGADKAAQSLGKQSKCVKIISFKSVLREGKDLTDFLVEGGTRKDIEALVNETAGLVVSGNSLQPSDMETYEVSLSESSQEQYYKKRIKMKVMVSGKTLSPYIVPKKVQLTCPLPKLKMCTGCALELEGGDRWVEFNGSSVETLQLVETTTDNHIKVLKKVCGVPSKCQIVDYEVDEAQNIEEAKVIPDLDFSDDDSLYVLRQIYYIGHGLEPNSCYELTGLTIPHPKTQQVTYLIDKAESLADNVSRFEVTEETIKQLKVFSVNGQDTEKA